MKRKLPNKHSKERFISPRVTQSLGLELEEALLGTSKEFESSVLVTGHNVEEYAGDSYWENN